jgi:hypothetical protein
VFGSKSYYTLYYPNADSVNENTKRTHRMKKQIFIKGRVTDNRYKNIVMVRIENFCSLHFDYPCPSVKDCVSYIYI